MILHIRALRSLRWNYTWRGVYVWLRGMRLCGHCTGAGYVLGPSRRHPLNPLVTIGCPVCRSEMFVRGYQRILSEPERVLAEQEAIAEGVMG